MLRCLLIYAACVLTLLPGQNSYASEKRDKGWLLGYLTQPISNTLRNHRYLKVIDNSELLSLVDHQ